MNSSNFCQDIFEAKQSLKMLQHFLICPVCKNGLDFSSDLIRCNSCSLQFSQASNDWFDLLPHHLLKKQGSQWGKRQQQMEDWYQNLIASPASASDCLAGDYAPYAPYLATLSGMLLDIGGGVGVVRHYLPHDTEYIVIDPSLDWLKFEWKSLTERFPCLKTQPCFVRGIGEYLPFPSQAFDTVLAFWSLNHVSDPQLVFHEVARVLRPRGRFLVVLEDMIPDWRDFIDPGFPASQVFNSVFDPEQLLDEKHPRFQLFLRYLRREDWPLQSDHIRIQESDIGNWTSHNFEVVRRVWMNQFLTFEFKKLDSPLHSA